MKPAKPGQCTSFEYTVTIGLVVIPWGLLAYVIGGTALGYIAFWSCVGRLLILGPLSTFALFVWDDVVGEPVRVRWKEEKRAVRKAAAERPE